ncbi:hypothetical protein COOONC_16129 [Cooperia oncophora]
MVLTSSLKSCLILFLFLTDASIAMLRCGDDDMKQGFIRNMLESGCKGRMGKIDACCVAHMKCYEKREPRATCDETLCNCAQESAKRLIGCLIHVAGLCGTTRAFGAQVYNKQQPEARPST